MAVRAVSRDRRGRPSAVVAWEDDGRLARACVRTPASGWIVIEPRAAVIDPWGDVDRLWESARPIDDDEMQAASGVRATPLTVATAIDWARPATIPVVAEPARLPTGASTALLNLVALRAREGGVSHVRYEGPYPSEALFLSLLECFDPEPGRAAPLSRFVAGDLAWRPAPFEPCFDDDIYVQRRRGRIEKVIWHGRTYCREDWASVRRWAALRVDDDGGTVRCALWALGRVLEDHVRLDDDGRPGALAAPHDAIAPPIRALAAPVRDGIAALVVAMSAPALAGALREEAAALTWTVGAVDGNLVRVAAGEARLAAQLAALVQETLADPAAGDPRAALAMLAEMARAFGDPLRARAQARLAAAGDHEQVRALATERLEDPGAARQITAAVRWLLASGRVSDEPDVERGEAADREH